MIEIYKRDDRNGSLKLVAEYTNYAEMFYLFRPYPYDSIADCIFAQFGYTDVVRYRGMPKFGDTYTPNSSYNDIYYGSTHFCYTVYKNDKFVTPDNLVGIARNIINARRYSYRSNYMSWSNQHWGRWYRHMRTFQERRWAHAWDDEEFAPKSRARRQGKSLPNSWDDYRIFYQRSWKTQTKRQHQWKPVD